jgi:hypothetical protein
LNDAKGDAKIRIPTGFCPAANQPFRETIHLVNDFRHPTCWMNPFSDVLFEWRRLGI